MAVKHNGKIVANKNARQLVSKTNQLRTIYKPGDNIWFIGEQHYLYEGTVKEILPNNYYRVEVMNKNIHKRGEWQTAVVEEGDLHFNKT